jgi:hypothetical protein
MLNHDRMILIGGLGRIRLKYSGILLGRLRKTTEYLSQDASPQPKFEPRSSVIRTENISQYTAL